MRFRVTGLRKGVYYHLRVAANNGVGWGRPGVLYLLLYWLLYWLLYLLLYLLLYFAIH